MAHTAVYGIYSTRQDAEMAIDSMRAAGFRAGDISVLLPDNQGTKDIGHEKHTKAPEKATAGAAIAGIAGGALGWLAGIGALAIPGIGPFIAAGPIMAALAGLGAGSVVGGLAGALIGAGIPEYEAKRYEGRIRSGGILLSVHCEDNHMVGRAKDLLRHTGAEEIASAAEGCVPGGPTPSLDTDRVRTERIAADRETTTSTTTTTAPVPEHRVTEHYVTERRPLETPVVVDRDPVHPPVIEQRVSDRVIIRDERGREDLGDTRRVTRDSTPISDDVIIRDERSLTDEERRRRARVDPPAGEELL